MAEKPEFDAFVVARWSALLRTAYLLTRDEGRAEDLVQAALTRLWFAWDRVEGDPEPYVRRILVNTHTSWWRAALVVRASHGPGDRARRARRSCRGDHGLVDRPRAPATRAKSGRRAAVLRRPHRGPDRRAPRLLGRHRQEPTRQGSATATRRRRDGDQHRGGFVVNPDVISRTLNEHATAVDHRGPDLDSLHARVSAVRRRRHAAAGVAAAVMVAAAAMTAGAIMGGDGGVPGARAVPDPPHTVGVNGRGTHRGGGGDPAGRRPGSRAADGAGHPSAQRIGSDRAAVRAVLKRHLHRRRALLRWRPGDVAGRRHPDRRARDPALRRSGRASPVRGQLSPSCTARRTCSPRTTR